MPIHINTDSKEFHLQGKNTSYIMRVMRNGQLGHIHFGKRISHRDSFSHLYKEETRGATSFVYEEDLQFSLDLQRQEYPSYGTTDYREPAFQIEASNGSRISNFTYQGYRLLKGKPSLDGLPAVYTEKEEEATSLEITLYDDVINMELVLLYTVFNERDIVTRSASFHNKGEEVIYLNRVLSASLDLVDDDYELVQLSGSWIRERHMKTRKLQPGIQAVSSLRGASSSQQNPFIGLKRPHTTEHQGEAMGFSLVYSGNFLAQVEVDHYDVARVSMGIHPFEFRWKLAPGTSFQTPEVVMAYSDQGLNGLSQTYHSLFRNRLASGKWRDRERPVLINNWEATYFDFSEDKLLNIAREAKELGVELFVLDDGWFGKRNDDTTSLGDWYVDLRKLPNGLKHLAQQVRQEGLKFGLWFEPEMVSKKSELYEEHPDWILHVPNRYSSHGRNQYVLDFSRQEVVDFIYQQVSSILAEVPIDYIKWDMNRNMTEVGSQALPPDQQQEVSHRYMLGVYELYERLTSAFPEVLFESCASGGARFDPGMLYYAPQGWTSDNTDAMERLSIQYGTSLVYPLSSMGAHVSATPNHQVGRTTSLRTRGNVAFFGMLGYELDITELDEASRQQMKEQIEFYKTHRSTIQKGTFFRLISPFENHQNETAWMSVSNDQSEAIVGFYRMLAKPNPGFQSLVLKGLDPGEMYKVTGFSTLFYGDELMTLGIPMETPFTGVPDGRPYDFGDFTSQLWVITRVKGED
ncbi:alpha-galactosidase [Pontibacillus yanchengensis]|uniref:Alpha-galactosidase n=2 Tax=Pontibacillus yanchengensis TaxID=462910 RepID=A0ACC7VDQ3_9BACI|nr:alpha-galactosidase [Pontibacillus yanchengensis]MYL32145.1 alpha-galactosidase [Pontibacillus yanchengensis]MYL52725.1 alpha-galactosidase [Pontibacillus yanchengensis]